MITAAIVSVVGSISYIGLIVPNLIAIFKGDDLRSTLADTALFGALFVLCCDVIGRLVIAPYELPIELITARSAVFSSSRSSSTDFVLGACRSTKRRSSDSLVLTVAHLPAEAPNDFRHLHRQPAQDCQFE